MNSIKLKHAMVPLLLLTIILLLTACAKGEAHVTVNTDGTADVKFNIQMNNQNLEIIGQPELIDKLKDTFIEQGFETESAATDDTQGLTASKQIDMSSADQNPELPDSVTFNHDTDDKFFYTTHRIVADADLMSAIPDNDWTDRLNSIPSFVRNLVFKEVDLVFKLTLPIKPESSNANQTSEDNKTMTWNINPLSNNHLELTVNVPNIQNILMVSIALLAVIVIVIIILVRKRMKKKRTPSE
ncbi:MULTISPECIES: DUF3153 domain-containing protein [unclassified Paenibacillus]|uniref:DUF3153 domain-containing protein n=1 Tax=Paenibacillus provencensis TaxID=441151 RepID=A0ABW3PTS8_9BACL|nr:MULTISPECIES: DUF3153 domain-containing protein [unclassified Paenibacillus]MCM3128959.1 DUF3153 domain-containing protein [Paenibacillus sp. MER 78]SFS50593.1 Protein of unknown function [Paenibacillus sp. 453mf]